MNILGSQLFHIRGVIYGKRNENVRTRYDNHPNYEGRSRSSCHRPRPPYSS
jgi:hypothetical protein